jgi:hypothetical protein
MEHPRNGSISPGAALFRPKKMQIRGIFQRSAKQPPAASSLVTIQRKSRFFARYAFFWGLGR